MKLKYALFVGILPLLIACSGKVEYAPLPAKAYLDFAKTIETAIREGDPITLDTSFDQEEFMNRISVTESGAKIAELTINENVKKSFFDNFKIGQNIQEATKDGYYTFLKHYIKDSKHHVVFRMFSVNQGLNYHDFELIQIGNQVKIADCGILLTGENLSSTMRTIMLSMGNSKELFGISFSTSENKEAVESIEKIQHINQYLKEGNVNLASETFYSIPEEIRKQKLYKIYELKILASTNEAEYSKAIEDYCKQNPKDASISLMMLDHDLINKRYAKVIKNIDNLSDLYGQDGVLQLLKGNIYSLEGKHPESIKEYETARTIMPNLKEAREVLISNYLINDQYAQAVSEMKELVKNSNVTKSEIQSTYQYDPVLMKNMEYQNWINE